MTEVKIMGVIGTGSNRAISYASLIARKFNVPMWYERPYGRKEHGLHQTIEGDLELLKAMPKGSVVEVRIWEENNDEK